MKVTAVVFLISFSVIYCGSIKRLDVDEVIGNTAHLHDDIQKLMILEESGNITQTQAIFYFLVLHDFDKNGQLDGLELIVAINHSVLHENNVEEVVPESFFIGAVDDLLRLDSDYNGYISYSELRQSFKKLN
ncbi:multiple coagulation factor deficiency protein 2 homolog [Centruroides sculpturatus]|uniref:multiple coagulation factor deficiency protein 2 homolog n=1 Tax=Centruroides sculpturatus TaxID=218467 RepID=UPI000C6EEA56|nr:multiple coagulation factor deficiency protein 2 homolog [Centruroides sculpturatus]XP_023223571.1 multiple coagulation factor deficiency protein 2 homolog [Centruroides sculpturatus]